MTASRSAIVTGAASGIGAEIARGFAADGIRVLLTDRSERVHGVGKQLAAAGGDITTFVADLEAEGDVVSLAAHACAAYGGCDILVNNAGINPKLAGTRYATHEVPTDLWDEVLRVNLTAPFLLCWAVLPGMCTRKWGRVVNVASRAGRTFTPNASLFYATTKAGLIGMTRQLAGEFAAGDVTVNCIAPGLVDTPLSRGLAPDAAARLRAAIPVGRAGTSAEMAAAVRYLASNAAGFITGACLDVNGGSFMG